MDTLKIKSNEIHTVGLSLLRIASLSQMNWIPSRNHRDPYIQLNSSHFWHIHYSSHALVAIVVAAFLHTKTTALWNLFFDNKQINARIFVMLHANWISDVIPTKYTDYVRYPVKRNPDSIDLTERFNIHSTHTHTTFCWESVCVTLSLTTDFIE